MIIKTQIYGVWLDFLENEVKPVLTFIKRFYVDGKYEDYSYIHIEIIESELTSRELLAQEISGTDITQSFDTALRKFVEVRWGHRI